MSYNKYLETIFFKVLSDLKHYLKNLIIVGGWLPYIYVNHLWKDNSVEPVTTTDIDFGFSHRPFKYSKTIFETLSSMDYKERHIEFGKIFPVVLYKEGKVKLDFITSLGVEEEVVKKFIGEQLYINKMDKFDFLLNHSISIKIQNNNDNTFNVINIPDPASFVYHKCATFIDRDDDMKKAKDLHYIYYVMRYGPDKVDILKKINGYQEKGIFKDIQKNLISYFKHKNSKGVIMVEKENGPDYYLSDIRQDIYIKFDELIRILL